MPTAYVFICDAWIGDPSKYYHSHHHHPPATMYRECVSPGPNLRYSISSSGLPLFLAGMSGGCGVLSQIRESEDTLSLERIMKHMAGGGGRMKAVIIRSAGSTA